jgi:hypothetical protein
VHAQSSERDVVWRSCDDVDPDAPDNYGHGGGNLHSDNYGIVSSAGEPDYDHADSTVV